MKEGHKAIVIWAILLVMGVAIDSMFAGNSSNGLGDHPAIIIIVGIGLLVVAVSFVLNLRATKRFMREQRDAITLLHQGELTKAKEVFSQWAESHMPRIAALSRHNVAWTLMRQGDLKQAIEVATSVLRQYPLELQAMMTFTTTMVDLALSQALSGDIAGAKKTMEDLDSRKGLASNASFPAMKVFTTAVIACRDGDAASASRVLDEKWASCESLLTGDVLRPMRVLRAFAIASADTRDAGKAELQLVNARPAFRGEYDFLGTAWPEMKTFLVANGLANPSDPAS